jgi:hypothetical protein
MHVEEICSSHVHGHGVQAQEDTREARLGTGEEQPGSCILKSDAAAISMQTSQLHLGAKGQILCTVVVFFFSPCVIQGSLHILAGLVEPTAGSAQGWASLGRLQGDILQEVPAPKNVEERDHNGLQPGLALKAWRAVFRGHRGH